MWKEILPLPQTVRKTPALDLFDALIREGDVLSDDALDRLPLFCVHGNCCRCQELLATCPHAKPVELSPSEKMYVCMLHDWSNNIDFPSLEDFTKNTKA